MKTLLTLAGTLAALWLLVVLAAYLLQDRMLFFPQPVAPSVRKSLKEFETRFDHRGTVLRGWLARAAGARHLPFLIYYGGNGEEISWNFPRLAELPLSGFLLVNYRGYGDSDGRPSAEALKSDAAFILEELLAREGLDPRQVVLLGRSLGSGVAMDLAARRDLGGLVLLTPFDRLSSLGAHHYPYLPVRQMLRHKMDSIDRAPEITVPALVVLAERDEVVPPRFGRELYEALPEPKRLVTVARAGHNDIDGYAGTWQAIEEFLRARARALPPEEES